MAETTWVNKTWGWRINGDYVEIVKMANGKVQTMVRIPREELYDALGEVTVAGTTLSFG